PGAGGGGHPFGTEVVLHRHGDPRQGVDGLPLGPAPVHLPGRRQGLLRGPGEEGVRMGLQPLHPVQGGLGHLFSRDLPPLEPLRQFVGMLQDLHHDSSRIRGTRKNPSRVSGALASTCPWGKEGRTVSGRSTLSCGTRWVVGSTPSVSTSRNRSKASRIRERSRWRCSFSSSVSPRWASLATRSTSSRVSRSSWLISGSPRSQPGAGPPPPWPGRWPHPPRAGPTAALSPTWNRDRCPPPRNRSSG